MSMTLSDQTLRRGSLWIPLWIGGLAMVSLLTGCSPQSRMLLGLSFFVLFCMHLAAARRGLDLRQLYGDGSGMRIRLLIENLSLLLGLYATVTW